MRKMPQFYLIRKIFLLSLGDYCAYAISLSLAIKIRLFFPYILPWDFPAINIAAYSAPEADIFPLLIVIIFFIHNLYQKRWTFWEETIIVWKALFISFLISYLVLFNFSKVFIQVSRVIIIITFLLMTVLVPLFRLALKKFLYFAGFWRYSVVLSCKMNDIKEMIRIAEIFAQDTYLGFEPSYFFIPDADIGHYHFLGKKIPVFHSVDEIAKKHCGSVFVIGASLLEQSILIESLYSRFRRVFVIPDHSLGLINAGVQYLFSERLFIINLENKLNSLTARLFKDAIDLTLGIIITILCMPLFFVVGLAVKLSSKGPIFYRQNRIGRGGKPFKIWKFRTMYQDADKKLNTLLAQNPELKKEWDTYFKLNNDPRITPIGHFLRKYSLDEFPQLFNVLAGEMSLIGPRPFVKGEIEELNPTLLPLYAQVKPGLTGLWQVSGRNNTDRLDRMKIDVWYIQNWQPSLDILILLNTPKAVLTARGAK